MVLTKLARRFAVVAALSTAGLSGAAQEELADLAARVDYGFHAQDRRVIEAARAALERLPDDDRVVRYHRAFAALRAAQLAEGVRTASALLDDCARFTPRDADAAAGAEDWVLAAACAAVAVERGLAQQRRLDTALARAAALDRDNPRLALVEAWILDRQAARSDPTRTEVAEKLATAIERFASTATDIDTPSWGEAEALARLGEIHLQRGDTRLARDLLERALLAGPDYRFALDLKSRLQRAPP